MEIEGKAPTSSKNRIPRKKERVLEIVTICFAELKKYKILLTTNVKRIKQVIKNYALSLSLGNCLSERFDWKKNYKEAFGGPCYKV